MLDRIVRWDDAMWFRQREVYLGTYGPTSFQPPGCPAPIVLEASVMEDRAIGLSPGKTVRRTPQEFAEHVKAVSRLIGRRAAQARGLVIQHGDFWNQPAEAIQPYLEVATEIFPIDSRRTRPRLSERPMDEALLDGIYAFAPGPLDNGPDRSGWSMLAQKGLRRFDIGVISVFSDVREHRGLLWDEDSLTRLVNDLQAAEIGVGLVVIVGSENARPIDEEAEATVSLVNSLGLRSNDHVYLIEASEIQEDSEGPAVAGASRRDAIRKRLLEERPKGGYRVVPYTLAKQ